jgi:hypothetical protein
MEHGISYALTHTTSMNLTLKNMFPDLYGHYSLQSQLALKKDKEGDEEELLESHKDFLTNEDLPKEHEII